MAAGGLQLESNVTEEDGCSEAVLYAHLTLIWSTDIGFFPLGIILTALRWVFMATSTPAMVPWMTVPFFSSIWTVSLDSFIKKRTSRTMIAEF